MSSVSAAFELARTGNSKAATDMLKEEFERLQSPGRMVELCEWIAACFVNLEDYAQAGSWYEAAGEVILSETDDIPAVRAIRAVVEYERALDCYANGEDDEMAARCGAMVRELRRSCASS